MLSSLNVEIKKKQNIKLQEKQENNHIIYELHPINRQQAMEVIVAFPLIETSRFWTPTISDANYLPNEYEGPSETVINYSMPLFAFFDELGRTSVILALSEAKYKIESLIGVHEESASIHLTFRIPPQPNRKSVNVYVDTQKRAFYQGIVEAREWLYAINSLTPLPKNKKAYQAVYSTWYSFHQDLNQSKLEKQQGYFEQNQLKTIILDDGWQTDDHNRRYAFAGEWEIAKSKFPTMKEHIKKFQSAGINYLLWITLPYIGKNTTAFARFEKMFLYYDSYQQAGIVDPRYPEVRQYLVQKISALVQSLNLDGLKIDFIDTFKEIQLKENQVATPALEDALAELLTELTIDCQKIKPDFLFEYREDYFGPWMNQLANMIRVKDCPGDFNRNRHSIANLRLLCPNAAIHSDMILFHREDSLESVAMQILHCLYGVIQLSVDFTKITLEQQQLLSFWLNYQKQNAVFLYEKEFQPLNPQANYNLLIAGDQAKQIVTIYQAGMGISLDALQAEKIDIINATLSNSLVLTSEQEVPRIYEVSVWSVLGELVSSQRMSLQSARLLHVPAGGLIKLRKWQGTTNDKNQLSK